MTDNDATTMMLKVIDGNVTVIGKKLDKLREDVTLVRVAQAKAVSVEQCGQARDELRRSLRPNGGPWKRIALWMAIVLGLITLSFTSSLLGVQYSLPGGFGVEPAPAASAKEKK